MESNHAWNLLGFLVVLKSATKRLDVFLLRLNCY